MTSTARVNGHQMLSANGRICWPQPIGESQAGHALVTRSAAESTVPSMLPKAASMKETPTPALARPIAPRAVDGSDAGESDTDQGNRRAGDQRPGRGLSRDDHAEPEKNHEHRVRSQRDEDGRGQGGVAADHAGAQHLLTTELLGLPRMPDDCKHAHRGREHGQGESIPVQGVTPDT